MGHTIELEYEDLRCKSREDAQKAADIITADPWMHPNHLQVKAVTRLHPGPGLTPCLVIDHFQGDHWNDDKAQEVWLAIALHMADGATIEFQREEGERWRIRWDAGRVFEDHVSEVIWSAGQELTPPQ